MEESFKEKKRIKDRKREEIWKEKNLMDKNIGELLAKRIAPWYTKKNRWELDSKRDGVLGKNRKR